MTQQTDSVLRAAECAGSQAALARLLKVTPSAVNQWATGLRPVPAEQCVEIERALFGAVHCEDLSLDKWQRVKDKTWPHPLGRPLLDLAEAKA